MHTLLIANRGEIARRIIRTAHAMGLRTVAVYTPPDADSPHVADADVAVALPEPSSYLDIAELLAAAATSGADAIHPGYGFLSENASFAEACVQAGLTFVGPPTEAIRTMGIKHEAKRIAREAGVPVLPDAPLDGDDPAGWLDAAKQVGFPLLVKASAGGGGKGMRLVSSPDELADAVGTARREAASSFGDGTVFAERYLPAPRHVEVQVFADQHGRVAHLLERECSIQRRHQKVVEECPSPAVSPALRARMCAAAVRLASVIGYVGAGTVEFLLDDGSSGGADSTAGDSGDFYFLELNTRLQVEHPVTEEVTGLDLVRLQLSVAAGEPLPFSQDDIAPRGHAIEVRLYAEDPARDWAPTYGPLWTFAHDSAVRVEAGVAGGGEVSTYYDPMLAKVIASGGSRDEAARRLARALSGMRLHGPVTNRDTLVAVLTDPDFLAGETRTDFFDRHPATLTAAPDEATRQLQLAAAIAVTVYRRTGPVAPPGWRLQPDLRTSARWATGADEPVEVRYTLAGDRLRLGSREYTIRDCGRDGVRVAGGDRVERRCAVTVTPDGTVWVNDPDGQTAWREQPRFPDSAGTAGGGGPVAEMPGTVTAVLVSPGDAVTAGQPLVLLEAMKMEHKSLAGADGVVESVLVEVGQRVEAHQVLVVLRDAEPG